MSTLTNNQCIKTKSVQVKKEYLGENINFKNVITTQLEVFFVEGTNTESIAKWISSINSYLSIGSVVGSLTIGGVTFSNCRILKAEFPTSPDSNENAISRGIYNLTIEETQNATYSADHMADNFGITTANWIDDVSEDINYSLGINNQFSLNHTVTITPNALQSSVTDASTLARAILDSWIVPNAWGLSGSSLHHLYISNAYDGILSSSINQITGEASWTRTIKTLSNVTTLSGSNYTSDYSHNLILSREGIITVTETGKLKYLSPNRPASILDVDSLSAELETVLLKDSATRASAVFSAYIGNLDKSYDNTTANPLITSFPIEVSRNINHMSQEASYSVSYVNDPKIDTEGRAIERSANISQSASGTVTINEKTNMIQGGYKGGYVTKIDPSVWYKTDVINSGARIAAVWSGFDTLNGSPNVFTFKETKRTVSYGPEGKNLSYNAVYSSDKNILSPSSAGGLVGIKKLDTKTSDKFPKTMIKEFPIAGLKTVIHNPGQTSPGSRTVSFSATLDRDPAFFSYLGANSSGGTTTGLTTTIKDARDYLAGLARTELLNVFADYSYAPDDIYVTDCTWGVTSGRVMTLTATAQYIQKI